MALARIGKAAEPLGVEAQTLRKWEGSGELIPDRRSKGGTLLKWRFRRNLQIFQNGEVQC